MYKRKETQVHRHSQSGRTRIFDATVLNTEHRVRAAAERSAYVKGAKAWNDLPAGIRNFQTHGQFKMYQKHELCKKPLNLPVNG